MWTISNEQMGAITESLVDVSNQIVGGNTMQTTNPVLPCMQVEVVEVSCSEPAQLAQKEILRARWLTQDDLEISGSPTDKNVKIQIETNGFSDGEKLKVKILDSKNKLMKSLNLTLNGNEATSDTFMIENEWTGKVLFINFEL